MQRPARGGREDDGENDEMMATATKLTYTTSPRDFCAESHELSKADAQQTCVKTYFLSNLSSTVRLGGAASRGRSVGRSRVGGMYATIEQQMREEEAEAAMQAEQRRRLATLLSDSAERWRETLHHMPSSRLGLGILLAGLSAWMDTGFLFLVLSIAWMGVQFTLHFKPSFCRTTGAAALLLSMLSSLLAPGPGHLATPFFEIVLCRNTSGGASALYGALPAGAALAADASCPATYTPLEIELAPGSLDADRSYRPVILAPAGSHTSLILSAATGLGEVYMPTKLELGIDDVFPWARALAPATNTLPSAAMSVSGVAPAAATAGAFGAAGEPSTASSATSFSASSRRNRRRLRGFGMRLGGFSRGGGGFGSPLRGVSQGPSRFGRGPTSALGAARPGAVGRPGATYHQTAYAGGGYTPTMGYHPSLGFDIATGNSTAPTPTQHLPDGPALAWLLLLPGSCSCLARAPA